MGVASPCQWGMGEYWEPSGCSLETTPGLGTVKQPSWRPAGGQTCGAAAGSALVTRWARESSGVLRLRSRLARYGPSGSPERSHRWKSAGFSVSSSVRAAGLGGGLRGVRTASRMPSHSLPLTYAAATGGLDEVPGLGSDKSRQNGALARAPLSPRKGLSVLLR